MKLMTNVNLAKVRRIVHFIGCTIVLYFGVTSQTHAQDISSIKGQLAAKQCPASVYSRIRYDDRGCGFSGQNACNQQYRAPSQAWQDCYHKLKLCTDQIDADNQVINEANRVYRLCNQSKSETDQSSIGNRAKTGNSSGGSPSEMDSSSSDLARRLDARRRKDATADEVPQQQDQQFNDTVHSSQEQYQQFKAQEQAERAAQERAKAEVRARADARARAQHSNNCVSDVIGYCTQKCSLDTNCYAECTRTVETCH